MKSIRTPQYQAMTAMGEALQTCLEIRLLFMATNAHLIASSGPNCSNSKFEGSKKTVPFEEISSTADELIIRSVFIRTTSENDYLIYYKVAAK